MTLTVQPVNPYKISPIRTYMVWTDTNGILTREAWEYLTEVKRRVGDTIGPLSADVLEGQTWEEPGVIGKITPASATFTFLTANKDVTLTPLTASATATEPASLGIVKIAPQAVGTMDNMNIGAVIAGTGRFTSLRATGAFSCNGAAPQASYTVGGTVSTTAATNVSPYGFTTAAQANDIVTKLNAVITALTNNGITV